jgi:hypothetical protein
MRVAIHLLALAFVSACTSSTPPPSDQVIIVWNRVGDAQETCQQLAGRKDIFVIRGCSKWNDAAASGQRICSIYAPMPRNETDTQRFATLGHELLHCFDGNWHDRWGRMNPPESQAATGASRKAPGSAAAAN